MKAKELLIGLVDLLIAYSHTHRSTVTRERYNNILACNGEVDLKDTAVREPLLEHVGHIPTIATYLYPHIEQKDEINLGRVLIMLAIHDIGETKTGDINMYNKSDKDEAEEEAQARSMLPVDLHQHYDEFIARETLDAKFAMSCDKMAPNIADIAFPERTMERMGLYGFTVDDMYTKKKPLNEWSPLILEIFELQVAELRRFERGEPGQFFTPQSS